jgi:hypothetical protein
MPSFVSIDLSLPSKLIQCGTPFCGTQNLNVIESVVKRRRFLVVVRVLSTEVSKSSPE